MGVYWVHGFRCRFINKKTTTTEPAEEWKPTPPDEKIVNNPNHRCVHLLCDECFAAWLGICPCHDTNKHEIYPTTIRCCACKESAANKGFHGSFIKCEAIPCTHYMCEKCQDVWVEESLCPCHADLKNPKTRPKARVHPDYDREQDMKNDAEARQALHESAIRRSPGTCAGLHPSQVHSSASCASGHSSDQWEIPHDEPQLWEGNIGPEQALQRWMDQYSPVDDISDEDKEE